MNGQQIDLKYPVISFNQFTIKDSLDHDLVVNGTLKQDERVVLLLTSQLKQEILLHLIIHLL
jgi:hypothetical protein